MSPGTVSGTQWPAPLRTDCTRSHGNLAPMVRMVLVAVDVAVPFKTEEDQCAERVLRNAVDAGPVPAPRAPVTVAPVMALAHAAAQLTWSILPASVPDAPPPARGAVSAESTGASDTEPEAIAGWHLFGQAQAADGQRDQRIDTPETQLDLQLTGCSTVPTRSRGNHHRELARRRYGVGDNI